LYIIVIGPSFFHKFAVDSGRAVFSEIDVVAVPHIVANGQTGLTDNGFPGPPVVELATKVQTVVGQEIIYLARFALDIILAAVATEKSGSPVMVPVSLAATGKVAPSDKKY
jgi:hypothetical protein